MQKKEDVQTDVIKYHLTVVGLGDVFKLDYLFHISAPKEKSDACISIRHLKDTI